MIRGVRVPPHLVEKIVPLYQSGKKGREIAALLGISDRSVFNYLRRFNVERRTVGTRHTVRHDAFSVITPESSYWAGFLFADGHIDWRCVDRRKSPVLTLKLAAVDREHVAKFRNFIDAGHAIHRTKVNLPNRQDLIGISVTSPRLSDDLQRLGMANRSLDRSPCPELAILADFWRGAIDGDGSLYWHTRKRTDGNVFEPRVHFVGGEGMVKPFAEYVRTIVREFTGQPKAYRERGSIWWSLTVATHQAVKLTNVLYRNAPEVAVLDRKAKLAKEFSTWSGVPLKTHCKHGHLLEGSNIRIHNRTNARVCRACARRRIEEFVRRKKASHAASVV